MKRRQRDNYPKEKQLMIKMSLIIIPIINLGSPPKKKKSKQLFLRMFIIFLIIFALFTGLMYFLSSRANVDDLQTIENKKFCIIRQYAELC